MKDISKVFEQIENHDIKVSTVFIPEDCADEVIEALKNLTKDNDEK